jgi:hypothetical protein
VDVESPKHLERLRDQPEVKAALLRFRAGSAADVAFERAPKNSLYRSALEELLDRFDTAAPALELQEACVVYGRPCWLLATTLSASPQSPLAVAVVAADGASVDVLLELLRSVSHDYWFGSYFFK